MDVTRKPKSNVVAAAVTPDSGSSVKCAVCGLLVDEAELKKHWDSAHLTKKAKTKHEKMGKGKKKRKKIKGKKHDEMPRIFQGGLCSPR